MPKNREACPNRAGCGLASRAESDRVGPIRGQVPERTRGRCTHRRDGSALMVRIHRRSIMNYGNTTKLSNNVVFDTCINCSDKIDKHKIPLIQSDDATEGSPARCSRTSKASTRRP